MASSGLTHPHDESDRFFDLSLDLLCVVGYDGTFVRVNPAWERTLGYAASELVGTSSFDLVHPDDVEKARELSARIARGEPASDFEQRYRAKDGSYRLLHWSAVPDREHSRIFAVARDISRARDERLAAMESERRFRELSEQSLDLIGYESVDGRFTYVSPACR